MDGLRSSLSAFPFPVAPQTLAGQIDAMGVVNEAIQNGVGVCWVRDNFVPAIHGKLRGDDRRAAAITLFEDFEQVVAGRGVERLEAPIVVCGRPPEASTFLKLRTTWSAAVICPASWCGA